MPAAVAVPLIVGAASAGATAYAANRSSSAAKRAAGIQGRNADYAADLEAKAAQDALTFAKEQEAARQREWQMAQDRNHQIYLGERAQEQQRYDTRRQDLAPYRQFGAKTLGQLARPIPGMAPGSLGSRIGR